MEPTTLRVPPPTGTVTANCSGAGGFTSGTSIFLPKTFPSAGKFPLSVTARPGQTITFLFPSR